MFQITNLRCEFATNPLGIEARKPRFSWELQHKERGQSQSAYQVLVASTAEQLLSNIGNLWDSGKVVSSDAPLVEYAGSALASRQRSYWTVRSWDAQDRPSPFSEAAWFEMGLLNLEDWKSGWIGFPGGNSGKALYFRTPFTLDKPVAQARAYVCGLGWYEFHLNGNKVGQHVLEPAQTAYSKRVLYTTYDILPFLGSGKNVVGAVVGNGWYGIPTLLFQLEFQFADGSSTRVASAGLNIDGVFSQVSESPIIENSVFDGEVYDARLEKPAWNTPEDTAGNFELTGLWTAAMAVEPPDGRLVAQVQEPIQVVETLHPKEMQQPKPGIFVFDMGQNTAGWARLSVQGPRGTQVTMRFAEMLYADGTVDQENLRSAKARDVYILKGEGVETWEPRFTYHGFRYVQIEGYPGTPTSDSVTTQVVRSAVEPIGKFECDNLLVNQLYKTVWWTEASNLHGIPTDCPQRDERMGWLNDMAARSEEAVYNFDVSRLWPKWMHDICDAQTADGAIPDTAPYRWGSRPGDPVCVCYLLAPWLLYRHYGDRHVLEDQYDGMKRWVDYLTTRAPGHIVEYSYYGDWASPVAESVDGSIGTSAVSRNTPGILVSTAHYFYAATLFSHIAAVLGRESDALKYRELAADTRQAFHRRFWDEARGGYATSSQGCNATALYMGLVPEDLRVQVLDKLVQDVKAHDYHLTTGNLASKYILEVLSEAGRSDVAFRLVTQTTYPSWGFMLLNGATTMWERWEKMTGRGMNSHNHPMYGSVAAWLYRVLGGIQALSDGPGFGKFAVRPYMPDDMKFARTSVKTIRGLVESSWSRSDSGFSLRVNIPVGSIAEIQIPGSEGHPGDEIRESGKLIWKSGKKGESVDGIRGIREETGSVFLTVNSGVYDFAVAHQ